MLDIFYALGFNYVVGRILTESVSHQLGEEALTSVNMSVLIHRNTLVSLLQLAACVAMHLLNHFIDNVNFVVA